MYEEDVDYEDEDFECEDTRPVFSYGRKPKISPFVQKVDLTVIDAEVEQEYSPNIVPPGSSGWKRVSGAESSSDIFEFPTLGSNIKVEKNRNKLETSFYLDKVLSTITMEPPKEEKVPQNKTRICKFFAMNGACTKMDSCKFLHEKVTIKPFEIREPMCKFALRNGCNRQETCRYRHVLEEIKPCFSKTSTACNNVMCVYKHEDDTFDSYKRRYWNRVSKTQS